jgi:hypothetical protein
MIKTGCCIVLSVLLFSINIHAQIDEAKISGFVTDEISGKALHGTNILLPEQINNFPYGTGN